MAALLDARVFTLKQGLKDQNNRNWSANELKDWKGARAQAGRLPPRRVREIRQVRLSRAVTVRSRIPAILGQQTVKATIARAGTAGNNERGTGEEPDKYLSSSGSPLRASPYGVFRTIFPCPTKTIFPPHRRLDLRSEGAAANQDEAPEGVLKRDRDDGVPIRRSATEVIETMAAAFEQRVETASQEYRKRLQEKAATMRAAVLDGETADERVLAVAEFGASGRGRFKP